MPTSSRILFVLVVAAFLAACYVPVNNSTAVTSASEAPLPTLVASTPPASVSAQPSASGAAAFPAIPGLTFDATRTWAEDFDFACQEGLSPPNRSDALLAAVCTRQSASDNAKMDLTIQYWPNNAVLAVSAAIQPIASGSQASSQIRTAFQRWASELPYENANPGKVLSWLRSGEDCSAGCAMKAQGVHWTRTTAQGLDAVSAFVPG